MFYHVWFILRSPTWTSQFMNIWIITAIWSLLFWKIFLIWRLTTQELKNYRPLLLTWSRTNFLVNLETVPRQPGKENNFHSTHSRLRTYDIVKFMFELLRRTNVKLLSLLAVKYKCRICVTFYIRVSRITMKARFVLNVKIHLYVERVWRCIF